jgi:hypothetical protein
MANIPVTIDPKYSITTPEQSLDLEKAFDKAFGPLHEITPPESEPKEEPKDSAPPEVAEPPPDEKEPPPDEKEPAPDKKEVVADKPATDPDDEPDEELDALKLHPDSRPETVDTFRRMRGMFKQEKKASKDLREKYEAQEKEIATLKTTTRPVNDPEIQRELENLRSFHTKHQIFDDSGYQSEYEVPIRAIFDDIVNDVKSLATDPNEAAQWEAEIRASGPDRLGRDYWNQGVIDQCSDAINKERLTRKISFLLDAQERRNQFRDTIASQPDAYQKFRDQQAADYWKDFGVQAEDEAKKMVATLGDWAVPKNPALAKNATERSAFEAHNETYKKYETRFQEFLTDAATKGPRGMTRVAIAALLSEKYKNDLDAANTRLTKLQAELKTAQDELNKIAGARSRVASSNGASGPRTEATPKKKLTQSLDDAFREHFGS